jgi:hypothetical protein
MRLGISQISGWSLYRRFLIPDPLFLRTFFYKIVSEEVEVLT